jgi:predicted DsbA family dithiol-disulfide isomerase
MQSQRALEDADLERVARDNGVNVDDWKVCMADASVKDEIMKDEQDGSAAGVTGTPAFFINGVFLNGAQPYERFSAIIDRELAAKKG